MFNRLRGTLRHALTTPELWLVVLGQCLSVFGNLLLLKLMTTLLTKAAMGSYQLLTSLYVLVSSLPFAPLEIGMRRHVPIYRHQDRLPPMLSGYFTGILGLLGIYTILGIGLKAAWIGDRVSWPLAGAWWWFAVAELLRTSLVALSMINRQRLWEAGAYALEFSGKCLLVWVVCQRSPDDIAALLAGFAAVSTGVVLWGFFYQRRDLTRHFSFRSTFADLWADIWPFSRPFFIWGWFTWLQNMSNRWLLLRFMDTASVAEFSLIAALAMFATNILVNFLGSFVYPILCEKENHQPGYSRQKLKLLLPGMAVSLGFATFLVWLLQNHVVLLTSDPKYLNVAWMLPLLFAGSSLQVLALISTYELHMAKEPSHLLLPSILPGIVALFAGFFLVGTYHMNGAVITFILTNVVYALLIFLVTIPRILAAPPPTSR